MPDDSLREHYLRALHLLRDMFKALAVDYIELAPDRIPFEVPRDTVVAWRTRAAALPLDELGGAAAPADGVSLIAAERRRQVDEEGFSADNDARHQDGQLIKAAGVYLRLLDDRQWPWPDDEPTWDELDDIPQLVKAGALIAAQLDRLLVLGSRRPVVGDYLTTRFQLAAAREHDGVVVTGTRSDIGPVLYVSKGGSWYAPGSALPEVLVCATGWTVERAPAAS